MHFRFVTAGESHGRALVALIEGVPAGLRVVATEHIDPELRRRQGGLPALTQAQRTTWITPQATRAPALPVGCVA